jgi:hypothetical protein
MPTWILRLLAGGVAFDKEGGGAGGGEGGGAGDGGDGAGNGEGGGAGAGGGGEGGQPGDGGSGGDGAGGDSSILNHAAKGGEKPEGGEKGGDGEGGNYKAPDYVASHLQGSTAEETLQKVYEAYRGARKAISGKEGGEGDGGGQAPAKPEDYQIASQGDDDRVAAALTRDSSKPFLDAWRGAAHKAGLSPQAFESFIREGFAATDAAGVPILATPEEARQISGAAELEKLTEIAGRENAGVMVNTVANFADGLLERRIITDDQRATFDEMVGTAEAAALFYSILTDRLGEKPIPLNFDGGEGAVTEETARANYSAALNMKGGPERDAAIKKAQADMDKAFGDSPSGSIRSSAL